MKNSKIKNQLNDKQRKWLESLPADERNLCPFTIKSVLEYGYYTNDQKATLLALIEVIKRRRTHSNNPCGEVPLTSGNGITIHR